MIRYRVAMRRHDAAMEVAAEAVVRNRMSRRAGCVKIVRRALTIQRKAVSIIADIPPDGLEHGIVISSAMHLAFDARLYEEALWYAHQLKALPNACLDYVWVQRADETLAECRKRLGWAA